MTDEELSDILAICDKATPGPWTTVLDHEIRTNDGAKQLCQTDCEWLTFNKNWKADFALMLTARHHLADIVRELLEHRAVRNLRSVTGRARAAIEAEVETVVWDDLFAIADTYEEEGDLATAAGYRWLAEHRRMPERVWSNRDFFSWTDATIQRTEDDVSHHLRMQHYDAYMRALGELRRWYPPETLVDCYRFTAQAIGPIILKELEKVQ